MILDTEKIKDILPHGSGVDYEWEVKLAVVLDEVKPHNLIIGWNKYHSMDGGGMYCCVTPFIALWRVEKDHLKLVDLKIEPQFDCPRPNYEEPEPACYEMLEDYLWQVMWKVRY